MRFLCRHKGNYNFVRVCLRRFHTLLVAGNISKVCRMKKFLFACAGVGLAIGGGYIMYRAWRNYYQGENNEADDLSDDAVSKTKTFFSVRAQNF